MMTILVLERWGFFLFLFVLRVVIYNIFFGLCSELELKPQGKLTLTVVKANDLKNMEMIGKSDPYVVVYIRPLFKVKTKVIDNNLNPVWDQTFEMIAEDKETQSLILEVIFQSLILSLSLVPWLLLLCFLQTCMHNLESCMSI